MHPPQLSLLVAQVLDTVLVYLRPLLGNIIEELVLHVPLNDNLIIAGHGSATREFSPERLGRHLQVHVECAEAGDHCHGLLLAARGSEYRYFPLHVVPVLLIRFYVALAAPLLPLLVVRIGGLAVLHLDLLELRGQVLLQPALAFLEFGIVLAVLEGMGGLKRVGSKCSRKLEIDQNSLQSALCSCRSIALPRDTLLLPSGLRSGPPWLLFEDELAVWEEM